MSIYFAKVPGSWVPDKYPKSGADWENRKFIAKAVRPKRASHTAGPEGGDCIYIWVDGQGLTGRGIISKVSRTTDGIEFELSKAQLLGPPYVRFDGPKEDRRVVCGPKRISAYGLLLSLHKHRHDKTLLLDDADLASIETALSQLGMDIPSLEQLSLYTAEHYYGQLDEAIARSCNDLPERRRARLRDAPKKPEVIVITSTVFKRNPDVIAEVLARAEGNCEGCKRPAPFRRSRDGTLYLEVHHRITLAEGGEDSVENAIALCPNCHRHAHFG